MARQKIIVVVGPTASGKSDLAIKLAKGISAKGGSAPHYRGAEIISADSRQVYRGMDIGTGKVSKKEQGLIPHHLLDVANPKSIFTVAHFQKLGQQAIQKIIKNKKLPIIVGGTGQYIDTLINNFSLPEVPPNYKLRAKLEKQTAEQLFAKLKKLDPKRAKNIDSKNPRRLIRALEIITYTKKPVGKLKQELLYEVLWFGLNPKNLDQRIASRLFARLKQGMIAEVKKLRTSGISWQRLHDFGLEYRWLGSYLKNEISKEEMFSGLEQAIRQYAKRQMTWFKRNKKIHWIQNHRQTKKIIDKFI